MASGRRKLLVEMATGTGKTRTAAALIKRLFQANAITRVLFLVDRIPLARQTVDALTEHLPDYPAYVLRGGRFRDEKRITVTTLQSMVNIYRDYSSGYFDLVVSDECHRSIYGKWSGVLKHFDGIQIGLTATPASPAPKTSATTKTASPCATPCASSKSSAPPSPPAAPGHCRRPPRALPNLQGQNRPHRRRGAHRHPRRTRLDGDGRRHPRRTHPALRQPIHPRRRPRALERRFTIPERNRAIVREFRKVDHGYLDKQGVLRKPLIGKTIVFAVTKRHAAFLAELFDQAFADRKTDPADRYADYVVSGLGPDDSTDGLTKIQRFKERFPQILVSVNMLDTGFDCPEVVNLMFARYTRSTILYQQMRGRGTRKLSGKPLFTLFDFVGVSDLHGDADTWGEGGVVRETPRRPPPTPRRLLALDIDDRIDPTTREWITLDEDGNIVRPAASEQRAAELGARFEAWRLQQAGSTPKPNAGSPARQPDPRQRRQPRRNPSRALRLLPRLRKHGRPPRSPARFRRRRPSKPARLAQRRPLRRQCRPAHRRRRLRTAAHLNLRTPDAALPRQAGPHQPPHRRHLRNRQTPQRHRGLLARCPHLPARLRLALPRNRQHRPSPSSPGRSSGSSSPRSCSFSPCPP
jgi:type I restriction enzyme R subunit